MGFSARTDVATAHELLGCAFSGASRKFSKAQLR